MNQQAQIINIDGVEYDFNSLSPEIRGTISLMEYARQQVQTAQMELAIKTAAHTEIGSQLRNQLNAIRKPAAQRPIPQVRTSKTPMKHQPNGNRGKKR